MGVGRGEKGEDKRVEGKMLGVYADKMFSCSTISHTMNIHNTD